MKIVSGKTGTPHVTSEQFRQIIEGTVGQGSYILTSGENLEPELASNNMLKIRGGMMSHHGNISCVDLNTYDEVTLTNGSQGVKRIDLIVNRYTRNDETGLEKNEWVVIIGTPDASNPKVPQHTIGNLQNGDLIDDCPVFEVHYDGINVTEVKKLLPVMSNLELLNGKLNMEKIIIVRNNKKSVFRHPQAYGFTSVTCPDLFFDNSEGLFSHSNGVIVCNQDAIIHAHAHFGVTSIAHYYTITINNSYGNSEIFYSYATSIGGYSGQTSNYFKVKKGDVISLSFGLNNGFSIAAKDLYAELDVRLVCVL